MNKREKVKHKTSKKDEQSRSKSEDPEQAELKAKAKEMLRAEIEEKRLNAANLAAHKTLEGTRKKLKLDIGGKEIPERPRIKRVKLCDLQFLMEQEKGLHMSYLHYKSYLK